MGVIDILQSYRFKKKLEHTMKSVIADGVSTTMFLRTRNQAPRTVSNSCTFMTTVMNYGPHLQQKQLLFLVLKAGGGGGGAILVAVLFT